MTTVSYLVAVVAFLVVVGGTLALGLWALRRQSKQYPKGTRLQNDVSEPRSIESKTTYFGGGHG